MLETAIQFLAGEFNAYTLTRTGSNMVEAKIGQVVNDRGEYTIASGSIGLSVINIEEDRTLKSQVPEHRHVAGQNVVLEPDLKLNLYILFAANYSFYDVALKSLSYVLTFFQSHPSFTPEEYPALDIRIAKLTVELQSPSYEQLNQIWGFIGAKQLPSALYKVRMIVLQDTAVKAVRPPITKVQSDSVSQ